MIRGKKLTNTMPSITRWLIVAQTKLNVKPAYVHSFSCLGSPGITRTTEPRTLNAISTYVKYTGYCKYSAPAVAVAGSKRTVTSGITPSKRNRNAVAIQKMILCFFMMLFVDVCQ